MESLEREVNAEEFLQVRVVVHEQNRRPPPRLFLRRRGAPPGEAHVKPLAPELRDPAVRLVLGVRSETEKPGRDGNDGKPRGVDVRAERLQRHDQLLGGELRERGGDRLARGLRDPLRDLARAVDPVHEHEDLQLERREPGLPGLEMPVALLRRRKNLLVIEDEGPGRWHEDP
ncbi:MAG: hypothetical protein RML56_12155 [Burkholderiales bacterium]|nr:hypothetical protein [Burkholderiales bacterium]